MSVLEPALLRQLDLLSLRARRRFHGSRAGGHLSLRRGHGVEFSDYRQYELGDNPRAIDWGVFGRTDKLYVKRYQEEQNLSVLIILDGSCSMGNPVEDGKWERAKQIALALVYVALAQQDSVTLMVPGLLSTQSLSGPQAYRYFENALEKVTPTQTELVSKHVNAVLNRVRFPGVAVFISDLLFEPLEFEHIIVPLRSRGVDLTTVQVLTSSELQPFLSSNNFIARDSENKKEIELRGGEDQAASYQHVFTEHQHALEYSAKRARVPIVTTTPQDSLSEFLLSSVARTGLLQ